MSLHYRAVNGPDETARRRAAAHTAAPSTAAERLLHLQRTVGNAVVVQLAARSGVGESAKKRSPDTTLIARGTLTFNNEDLDIFSEQTNGTKYDQYWLRSQYVKDDLAWRDAEAVALEKIAFDLYEFTGGGNSDRWVARVAPQVTGTLRLEVSRGPCNSCRFLIKRFARMLPRVSITVAYPGERANVPGGREGVTLGFGDAAGDERTGWVWTS